MIIFRILPNFYLENDRFYDYYYKKDNLLNKKSLPLAFSPDRVDDKNCTSIQGSQEL